MNTKKHIALRAGFVSLKFLPSPLSIGGNNINPKLVLDRDHFEYRGLFSSKARMYSEIEEIDIYVNILPIFSSSNISFKFKDSPFTFSASLRKGEELIDLLIFLQEKGCKLSKKAHEFIS